MNLIDTLIRMDGRISRKPFWIGTLVLTALFVAVIVGMIVLAGEEVLEGPYSGNSATSLVAGALTLVLSVPLMLKRLHDLNQSFRLLVPVFVLEALAIAGDLMGWTGNETDLNPLGWGLVAVYGIYALALFIYLGFYRGTAGTNDFGPDPLRPDEMPAPAGL